MRTLCPLAWSAVQKQWTKEHYGSFIVTHTDKGIHIERRTHRYTRRDTYTNTHVNTKRHTNTSINIQTHTLKEKGKWDFKLSLCVERQISFIKNFKDIKFFLLFILCVCIHTRVYVCVYVCLHVSLSLLHFLFFFSFCILTAMSWLDLPFTIFPCSIKGPRKHQSTFKIIYHPKISLSCFLFDFIK